MTLALLFACASDPADVEARDATALALVDGTPEALGVLAMLDDATTTVDVLDVDARLDARAARNLVAHRDGPDGRRGTLDDDRFDDVAEVDAVAYVGDATLQLLVDFARAGGWIPAGDDFYGVVEGVTLTKDEAAAALRVANGATFEVLDLDVGLDVRAATGIVDGRPFDTLEDVALVSYVGATAVRDLVDYGVAHPVVLLDADGALTALELASAGLWFTSESDYPVEAFVVPGGALDAATATTVLAPAFVQRPGQPPLEDLEAEEVPVAWFFDRYTVAQDWWEPERHEVAPRWQALRDVVELQLEDARVYRLGVYQGRNLSGQIDVFVVGRTADGAWAGVRTVSVET